MQSVKNVSRNGRTVMVTIHQPSIDIFEAFDALVLLQRGGKARPQQCRSLDWRCAASNVAQSQVLEAFDALVLLRRGGKARPPSVVLEGDMPPSVAKTQ